MIKHIQWILILSILGIVSACSETPQTENQELESRLSKDAFLIESKSTFCPDKRVCVWTVEWDSMGTLIGEVSDEQAFIHLKEYCAQYEYPFNVALLPDASIKEPFGLIKVSVAQIRSKPKHSSELLTQALLGHPAKVIKQENDWLYVQLFDGYLGWIETLSFQAMSNADFDAWNNSNRALVLDKFIPVYNEDDLVVNELVAGNIVQLSDNNKIVLPDNQSGYSPDLNYISINEWGEAIFDIDQMIETAKGYMGIPYVWGGTSSKGFDCSGFTKTAFLLNGIQLPRDASQQVHCGTLIDDSKQFDLLEVGDLLFFGRKATDEKAEKVTHVGIYLGEGSFIHASGEVRIQSLFKESPDFAPNRYDTYLRAKRITADCIGTYQQKL